MKIFNKKSVISKLSFLVMAGFILIATSCSKPDKKTELADLKSQQKEIEVKIKALEKELGATAKIDRQPLQLGDVSQAGCPHEEST